MMKTMDEKLAFIIENVGKTRVKFNPETSDVNTTYKNVRNAIRKQEAKSIKDADDSDLLRKEAIANAVHQAVDLDELDSLVEYFNKNVEKKRNALRESTKRKLEKDIADMENALQKAKERLITMNE